MKKPPHGCEVCEKVLRGFEAGTEKYVFSTNSKLCCSFECKAQAERAQGKPA